MVAYNPSKGQYYTGSRNMPGGPVFGVIDSKTNALVQKIALNSGNARRRKVSVAILRDGPTPKPNERDPSWLAVEQQERHHHLRVREIQGVGFRDPHRALDVVDTKAEAAQHPVFEDIRSVVCSSYDALVQLLLSAVRGLHKP
jgi:hypothetical protein